MNNRLPSSRARQIWLERVETAFRTYGVEGGGQIALQALAEGVEDVAVLNLGGLARYSEGRYDEAARLLRKAKALSPKDPHILNSLGASLQASGQPDDALKAYDAAIRADENLAAAHFNRGVVLEELNDLNAARAAYEKATALDESYVEPLARLAFLHAQAGDIRLARMRGEQARALQPSNVLARIALASVELQEGRLAEAGALLLALLRETSLTPVNRVIVQGLIGDLYDAGGKPAEAFDAYRASNAQLKALSDAASEVPGQETALDQVRRVTEWFAQADRDRWAESPPMRPKAADPKMHVFLVGFPRSGTTLLENVLAAHSDVVSLEEADCLTRVATPYLESNGGLERLSDISGREAARQRDVYWARVRSFGIGPRGKVFIDKMPLASVQLPVIAKLFPAARILFAIRDPRDVVLSCFRRRFAMNRSMYELLTLEGAASFYDAVMRLAEIYRDRLPLLQHITRYESLVDDFEKTARAAFDFMGVHWSPGVFEFADKARARGIDTPSAAQVARGLNREGQGAWRRYEAQMAPVMPLLQPWVERFGYA